MYTPDTIVQWYCCSAWARMMQEHGQQKDQTNKLQAGSLSDVFQAVASALAQLWPFHPKSTQASL